MPIELKRLDGGGSLLVGTGKLTGKEILTAINTVHETEEKTRALVFQIGDFRSVQTIDIIIEDVRRIVYRDELTHTINPNIITAVVAEKDILLGYSQIWQLYSERFSPTVGTFRSMDEAEQWVAEQVRLKDTTK